MIEKDTLRYPISPTLYNITQRQITHLDQEVSNGESWNYYCNGQVTHPIVFKNEISGIIKEYPEEYKVQIKVNEHEISCTCSCGSQDTVCKHVVALLYSWVCDQEEFVNAGKIISQLHEMDRELLIKLVERFLTDDPQNIKFFKKQEDLELDEFELEGLSFE